MNTFGTSYRLTSFGESHGVAVGGVIDGMLPGIEIDLDFIQKELDRRRPGQNSLCSQRNEPDQLKILSGIFEGKTLGTPIGFYVENKDQNSTHYRRLLRPNHADATYLKKYGIWDYRGGGRASARETLSRVVAGAFAKLALRKVCPDLKIVAYVSGIGKYSLPYSHNCFDTDWIKESQIYCPDKGYEQLFIDEIKDAIDNKDSVGGSITCVCYNAPVGIGEPTFGKLSSRLADAMMTIPGSKGFEYGVGFRGSTMNGYDVLDEYYSEDGFPATNFSGGIQGGISNGNDIYFNVAFKPVATIPGREIKMIEVNENNEFSLVETSIKGRHDPCIVPRAVAVVESMTAMVILDLLKIKHSISIHE